MSPSTLDRRTTKELEQILRAQLTRLQGSLRAAVEENRTTEGASLTDMSVHAAETLHTEIQVTLVGRRTEMYIRGGYNVYPGEVEDVLGELGAIDRVAIIGMPDPVLGEIGIAFVVASQPITLEEIRSHVASRLADYKRPDRLVVADDLPLTPMLKVDKKALRARLEQEALK